MIDYMKMVLVEFYFLGKYLIFYKITIESILIEYANFQAQFRIIPNSKSLVDSFLNYYFLIDEGSHLPKSEGSKLHPIYFIENVN